MHRHYMNILYLILATFVSYVAGQTDFAGANWIWIAGRAADQITYPPGNAAFRRDFSATNGRVPVSANILITTDNAYTLYVNGKQIGTGVDLRFAQRYCVPLVNGGNVFAISAQNYQPALPGNAAGVLAVIKIRYSNGFVDTIVTDAEWHGIVGTPAGFQQVAFDDSKWPAAFVQGRWPTTAPWNQPQLTISIPSETRNPGPSLESAQWIWTNELASSIYFLPKGSRGFRKTVTMPAGQFAVQAKVYIAADDRFNIYINGLHVSAGGEWRTATGYVVNLSITSRVVIAIYATNGYDRTPAGVLAAFELVTWDCSNQVHFATDRTWKYSLNPPVGFISPDYDDSAWPFAVTEGGFGTELFNGPTAYPTKNSPRSLPTDGAPNAFPADVVV